jgi:hypothetical protein
MESPDQAQPTVAISYAWKREDKRYKLVEGLCERLNEKGINVFWDRLLKDDDILAPFYERLAKSDVLIALISDEYFRSDNCMLYELLPAFRHVGWDLDRFSKKVIFLIDDSAMGLFTVPATSDSSNHPLKPIRDHWQGRLNGEKSVGNNQQNSPLARTISDLLDPDHGINRIYDCICKRVTLRSAEIWLEDYQGVLDLVNNRIRLCQKARRQDSNPRLSNQDERSAYRDDLRKRPITGLPIPDRPGVPVPPKQNAPRSLSLSLMLILKDSNEPGRYMLIPELHVFSSRKADLSPDQWPDPLKQAQILLQNFDHVTVMKTGELRVVKSRGTSDGLGHQVKTWLDVVKAAATQLNQRSSGLQPEVVEIVVPKTLLHHDFGASLRVPVASDTPLPLATHECFMVRSLERAQEHCKRGQTALPQKWRGSVSELLVVHVCEDHADQWHDDLFKRTQGDNIRFCVVLPSLSSRRNSRQRLLNSLVDSFLPLVVYWPPGESDANDCATRLQYVYNLLAASPDQNPSSSAAEADEKGFAVVPLKMKQQGIKIHGIAKQRKNLNTQSAMNNQSAIVLMDHPDRWPRCVTASQSPLSSPTVT